MTGAVLSRSCVNRSYSVKSGSAIQRKPGALAGLLCDLPYQLDTENGEFNPAVSGFVGR